MHLCVINKGDNKDPISMTECGSRWTYKVCLFSSYLRDTCTRVFTPTRSRSEKNNKETTELSIFLKGKKSEVARRYLIKKIFRGHPGGTVFQGVLLLRDKSATASGMTLQRRLTLNLIISY